MITGEERITAELAEFLRDSPGIMGIGNPLRSDDGFGPAAAALLHGQVEFPVIDAGSTPENYFSVLRRSGVVNLLVIDCVRADLEPGEISLLEPAEVTGKQLSTHSIPLDRLADYLKLELGIATRILGVQPSYTGFGDTLTPAVARALKRAARLVLIALRNG